MKKAKWLFSVMAILMAVSLFFAGCKQTAPEATKAPADVDAPAVGDEEAPGGFSTEPVTIQFWNGWTGGDGELLRALVDHYNQNNAEGVTVQMDIMEHAALTEKMATALVSNTAPALHLNFANADYAVNGQLVPIDDIFEMTDLDKEDFDPAILANMYYDGQLYGLPFQVTSNYLFWNKDLFAAAGLDPETPPATYEEMYEFAKQITDPSKNIFGGGPYYNNSNAYVNMILAYGGGLVGGDAESGFTSLLTDPEYYDGNLEAMKLYERLVDEGLLPTYSGSDEMFLAGTLGMQITGAWLIGACKTAENLNWGISLLPEGPAGRVQNGQPIAMVVMKGTEGRELEAAKQFMAYWNNNTTPALQEPGNTPVAQWNKVLGYQPYLISIANDEEYLNDPIVKITSGYLDYVKPHQPSGFYMHLQLGRGIYVPMLENIAFDVMTPEDALVDAENNVKALIESMNED